MATITLHVKHYKDSEGVEHIDIDQTLTGGIKGTTENRVLNWEYVPSSTASSASPPPACTLSSSPHLVQPPMAFLYPSCGSLRRVGLPRTPGTRSMRVRKRREKRGWRMTRGGGDWEEQLLTPPPRQRPHEDHLFGKVVSQSRRVDISEITDPHMNSGWEADWIKEGVIENFVVNEDNDWTAAQVWGFEKINGEKRYVRHLILDCPKRKKTLKKKLVYDYVGPEQ